MTDLRIVTARAVLRPWRHDEAARLFDILRRPEVTRWLGDPTPLADLARAHEKIDDWAAQATPALPRNLAIVPNDGAPPAGYVMLRHLPEDDTEVEIGWVLHPDATGQGWASEAATALLEHAAAHGTPRVWAVMWPDNHASAAVAMRIGMRDLGTLPDPWYGTPEAPDSRMLRIDLPRRLS